MREPGKETATAVLACAAAMLCFSVVPVFLRHLTVHFDSWTVNAVRYSTAAVFWLPFVVVLGRRFRGQHSPPGRLSVWQAALIPAAVNLLGQVGWANCPYHADAPTIAFVIRTSFLFTVMFGFVFIPSERELGRRSLFLLGAAVCMAGVVVMFVGRPAEAGGKTGTSPVGLAIILGTALCWGAYAVSVRRFMGVYPLRLAFGVVCLYTTGGLIALMFLAGEYQALARAPVTAWAMLIISGLLGVAFGHVLYYRGIRGIGPVVASGTMLAGPFVTYLAAAAFLPQDRITPVQLLGGVVVVAGGAALVRARAQIEKQKARAQWPAGGGG